MELENQPTSQGACYGSHWEQRLFTNELMASTSSHAQIYSALTLAALEDSGWCASSLQLSSLSLGYPPAPTASPASPSSAPFPSARSKDSIGALAA